MAFLDRPPPTSSTSVASVRRACLVVALALLAGITLLPGRPFAQSADVLGIASISVDPPTLHVLGVQILISGDQNRNARVAVRYRPAGSTVWREGLPLFRVFPETVSPPVPEQFAGSIFDLTPDTAYEIELHATDPDGPVDWTRIFTARTRPVPRANPVSPRQITVTSAAALQMALGSAAAGDVIVVANGIYPSPFVVNGSTFTVNGSGTAENPIVIRGETATGAILDGQNCSSCNVLEVSGSYVHVENLTIQNALRALRFTGAGTRNNVVRRVHITNVVHGIAPILDQRDFYICDNVIEGRLVWPWVFQPDVNLHVDDRGVAVYGDGHVVCHNTISGFGDPMINMKSLARAIDFYGNEIRDSFDGTELDLGGGNVRVFHNRWTNVSAGVSLQPVYGGPAYVLRNVLLNVVDEQIKFKSLGTDEPSGALLYHNTFVSPEIALNLQTPVAGHNLLVMNNLFVGPRTPAARAVEWTAPIDRGRFDFNGYFPDGGFWLGNVDGLDQIFDSFAALQASGVFETAGTLLAEPIFAAGFVGPTDGTVRYDPADVTLASASNAIDRGTPLPGINQSFRGAGPDLGALESGCPIPTYGPRPEVSEQFTFPIDCTPPFPPTTRFEEMDPPVSYGGPWVGNTDKAWSGGMAALSATTGAQATFTFSGTSVSWIGFRGPQTGIARVFLDGALAAEVDTFSATEELRAAVFTTTGLADTSHTLTIEVMGLKNAAATDAFIVVDAFESPSQPVTRFQERDPSVLYTAGWTQDNAARAWSGGTTGLSATAGARATFAFTGTSVRWLGFRGPQTGIARVFLDGAFVAEVDTFSAGEEVQADVFRATGLADASHTLTIEVTGLKNAAATGAFIVVDAFDVTSSSSPPVTGTRFEETEPSIAYTAGWAGNTDRPWTSGTAAVATTAGARATFTFTGTSVRWIGFRGPQTGIARVFLDGALVAEEVDTFSTTEELQAVLFTTTGLAAASHTLTIEVTGLKNATSSDPFIVVDAFDVTP